MYGGEGDDTILGYKGNNSLYGEAGNDVINSGQHSSFLDGGAGADTFVFTTPGAGRKSLATVTDFEIGSDALYVSDTFVDIEGQLPDGMTAEASGEDLLLHIGGDDVITFYDLGYLAA